MWKDKLPSECRYFETENGVLYRGDCLDVMQSLVDSGVQVDAVITDPPYGMAYQSNWSKSGPRHNRLSNDDRLFTAWLPIAYQLVKPLGGALLSFCGWKQSYDWARAIANAGFVIRSQVIWNRLHHGMGDLRGAFAPMHDIVWYATRGRRVFANGRPKSVLEHKRPSPSQDYGHPTFKPVSLMEELARAIDDGSAGAIIDPFAGSGSTLVAAERLGRRWIGIELSEEYCSTVVERVSDAAK